MALATKSRVMLTAKPPTRMGMFPLARAPTKHVVQAHGGVGDDDREHGRKEAIGPRLSHAVV